MNNKKRIVVFSIIALLCFLTGDARAHGFTLEIHIIVWTIIACLFAVFLVFIFIIVQIVRKYRNKERGKGRNGGNVDSETT